MNISSNIFVLIEHLCFSWEFRLIGAGNAPSHYKLISISPAASDKRIPESKIMATNHLISSSKDSHSALILAMLDGVTA
jgi:hypothetical protein